MAKTKRIVPTRTERGVEIGPTDTSFGRRVTIINAADRWPNMFHMRRQQTFILAFGQVSATYLMVYADHLQDALDECIDWIAEHTPGMLCNDEVEEEYKRLLAEGKSEEEAMEEAEADTTCGGNAGDRILSYEWTVAAENLTRQELDEFLYPPGLKWKERTHCIDDQSRWQRCHHPVRRDAWYPYTEAKPVLPDAGNQCPETP